MEFDYEMITEKEFDAMSVPTTSVIIRANINHSSLEKKHSLDEILSRKYPGICSLPWPPKRETIC